MEENARSKGATEEEEEVTVSLALLSTKRIWKNLLVISFVFLFNFTAFRALQNLQSTLNREAGLGVVSLSCAYAAMLLSCLYAPFLLHKVGSCKWTVVLCFFGHVLYTASNFYPSWYTLVPSSVLLGAISGPLWTAQLTYLATSAQQYAKLLQHGNTEDDLAKFNGVFYFVFELAGISGNLIASVVLSKGRQDIGTGEFCGAMDCQAKKVNITTWVSDVNTSSTHYNSTTTLPEDNQEVIVYTLFGVFLGCNILAALVTGLCLDKDARNMKLASVQVSQHLLRTVRVFKDVRYVLLTPLLVTTGISEALVAGDFTKSYVSCVLGVQMVGYVMISYSGTSSVLSPLFGHLSKYVGTRTLILATVGVTNVLLIYMLLWQPSESSTPRIFAVAAGWGLARAICNTQIYAVLGATFPNNKEAVYANSKMTQSCGIMVTFALSSVLCMDVKLYIYIIVLAIGLMGYGAFEWKIRNVKDLDQLTGALEEVTNYQGKSCHTVLERCDLLERETSL